MKSSKIFNFKLSERFLENYADPPEDPLGELSHFEMGWRLFCFERDRKVLLEIDDEKIQLFLDLDICLTIENNFPQEIAKLSQGEKIEIDFPESWLMIRLLPQNNKIVCTLTKFGTSYWEKQFEFDRPQVLDALRNFLEEVMQLAVDEGYITLSEKEEFISPAFASISDPLILNK
ncbi:MAG: hypothetical protein HC849_22210 [Oscillatoriales cyanobacterium RU_3_3]|nr:hypothetical protein [Oscillatoriales cyanobacterium RU_3_3]